MEAPAENNADKNVEVDNKSVKEATGDTRPGSRKSAKNGEIPPANTESADNPSADLRNMRRIIAEDSEWNLATVPLLIDICLTHLVNNFENNSELLHDLLPKHKAKVLSKISVNLPLKVTANLVENEDYWKRRCQSCWQICDVSAYNNSWKCMFFERNLQRIIEKFIPESTDPTELNEALKLSANFVKKLEIKQLLPPVKEPSRNLDADDMSDATGSEAGDGLEVDHFDFGPILKQLPHLTEFSVTYGVKDCGMNFEWILFQFTARDCLQLAKCIAGLKTLKIFRLHRSKVDDDKVRVLISHLLEHPGLIELDLSHNVISDRGARAIGKFINNHSQLVTLCVCDNNIRAAGAQAIAHALTKNTLLKSLDLRMNRLADDGGQPICRAMLKNKTLEELNLSSNDLTEPTAAILYQVLLNNNTLTKLNLSANRLGLDGGKQLQEGMEENDSMTQMDLRLTECGQESIYCINQKLKQNRELARSVKLNRKNTDV